MIAQIGLGILVLASFICCYLAAKRWHWSHVFMCEVLFLSSLLFVLLAVDVLRLNKETRGGLANVEQNIDRQVPLVRAIVSGTRDDVIIDTLKNQEIPVVMDPNPDNREAMQGVDALDHRLGMIARVVGRKWEDAQPQGQANPQTGAVTVKLASLPHGIEQGAIFYVFEEGEPVFPDSTEGPQYLGEFRVKNSAADSVALEPVGTLEPFDLNRIATSRAEWVLYETMPVDQHPDGLLRLFADATDEELAKMVPAESLTEYQRHGGEATNDDDQWHKVGLDADGNVVGMLNWDKAVRFEYQRLLRDYSYDFLLMSKNRIQLLADKEALLADNKKLQGALASAKLLQAFRQEEQRRLKIDVAGVTRDRQAIEKHLAAVETSLANATQLLATTLDENLEMAKDLAAAQMAVVREMNSVSGPEPARAESAVE